jgi:hypothetical protein
MLLAECAAGGVTHWQPCGVTHGGPAMCYEAQTSRGTVQRARRDRHGRASPSPRSAPSDFGYRIARSSA